MSESASSRPQKLLDQLRDTIHIRHYSYSTEKTHVHWAKRYILFNNKRHLAEMGVPEIEAFLTHLAQDQNVSAFTQNQAFDTLLFLYRNVLHIELDTSIYALRAKDSQHLPPVLPKIVPRALPQADQLLDANEPQECKCYRSTIRHSAFKNVS